MKTGEWLGVLIALETYLTDEKLVVNFLSQFGAGRRRHLELMLLLTHVWTCASTNRLQHIRQPAIYTLTQKKQTYVTFSSKQCNPRHPGPGLPTLARWRYHVHYRLNMLVYGFDPKFNYTVHAATISDLLWKFHDCRCNRFVVNLIAYVKQTNTANPSPASLAVATCNRLTVVISISHVWDLLRTEDVHLHTPALRIGTHFLLYLRDSSLSLSSFKHHLKTFLFSFY